MKKTTIFFFLLLLVLSCNNFNSNDKIDDYYKKYSFCFSELIEFTQALDSLTLKGYTFNLSVGEKNFYQITKQESDAIGDDRIIYVMDKIDKYSGTPYEYYYKDESKNLSSDLIKLLDSYKEIIHKLPGVISIRVEGRNNITVVVSDESYYLYPITKSMFEPLFLNCTSLSLNDLLSNYKSDTQPKALAVSNKWYFVMEDLCHGIN